jgi:hypothetical protein
MSQIVYPGPDGTVIAVPPTKEESSKRPRIPAELPPERRPASWIMTTYRA